MSFATPLPLRGSLALPGDKSISHRALMFAALVPGNHRLSGLLDGGDVRSTAAVLSRLGIQVDWPEGETTAIVHTPERWQEPDTVLDAGNSGTTMRLMAGLLAPQGLYAVMTGDDSLRRRPMGRVIQPLRQMGAAISGRANHTLAPLTIQPSGQPLAAGSVNLPHASAQVKSALLLASLWAKGTLSLTEPSLSRDHTERALQGLGVSLSSLVDARTGAHTITLPAGQADRIRSAGSLDWAVPGDISSAAFPMVAALMIPGSAIRMTGVGVNPTRMGLVDALQSVGARISLEGEHVVQGEPVADLVVEASSLRGDLTLTAPQIPGLIDEIPILAMAGVTLDGTLTVNGAEELRRKESDRLAAIATELGKLGVEVEVFADGFRLVGEPGRKLGIPSKPLEAYHDHRIAMALTVLNRAVGETTWPLNGREWVGISWPGFFEAFDHLQTSSLTR